MRVPSVTGGTLAMKIADSCTIQLHSSEEMYSGSWATKWLRRERSKVREALAIEKVYNFLRCMNVW